MKWRVHPVQHGRLTCSEPSMQVKPRAEFATKGDMVLVRDGVIVKEMKCVICSFPVNLCSRWNPELPLSTYPCAQDHLRDLVELAEGECRE